VVIRVIPCPFYAPGREGLRWEAGSEAPPRSDLARPKTAGDLPAYRWGEIACMREATARMLLTVTLLWLSGLVLRSLWGYRCCVGITPPEETFTETRWASYGQALEEDS